VIAILAAASVGAVWTNCSPDFGWRGVLGILIEQLKLQAFHMDLSAGDRMLCYTTTGWMMWNFLVSSLLLGVQPVLYDGSPGYPAPDVLWRLVQDARVTFFGASPPTSTR